MVKKITKLLLLTTLMFALTVTAVNAVSLEHYVTPNSINTYISDHSWPSPGYDYYSELSAGGMMYGVHRDVDLFTGDNVLEDNFQVRDEYGALMGGVTIDTGIYTRKYEVNDHFETGGFLVGGSQTSGNTLQVWGLDETGLYIDRNAMVTSGYILTDTNWRSDEDCWWSWNPWDGNAVFYSYVEGDMAFYSQGSEYRSWTANQGTEIEAIGNFYMNVGVFDNRGPDWAKDDDWHVDFWASGSGFSSGSLSIDLQATQDIWFIDDHFHMWNLDYEAGSWPFMGFVDAGITAHGDTSLIGSVPTNIYPWGLDLSGWFRGY